jgi:acetyltransferase-like isoleucine patch superfamily enzyme
MRKGMSMIRILINLIRFAVSKVHSAIDPIGYAKSIGVRMGKDCRLLGVNFGTEPYLVTLGDHVSATTTLFITHDGAVWVFREKYPDIDVIAPIKVGNNVFIGAGTKILPGVTIGDNVIIGAGALVTKNIPSNCVAAGMPAKPINSIDEYCKSILPQTVPTKLLSPKEKRDFLEKHFQLKN